MTDLGILICCSGIALAAVTVSAAQAYKIITEIKIKKRAFEASLREPRAPEVDPDELNKRLEEFRRARFAPPIPTHRQKPVK